MKAIVIGTSLSGKSTIIKYLNTHTPNLPILEIDDELARINGGKYPEDTEYKHKVIAPQVVKDILGKENIIFFTNTDYFTVEDLIKARKNNFKIIQMVISLEQLKKRNEERVKKEGRDDWSRWFVGMLNYQKNIRELGLVDKIVSSTFPVEITAKEILKEVGFVLK